MVIYIDGASEAVLRKCLDTLERKMSRHKEVVIRILAKNGDEWAKEQVRFWDYGEDGKLKFPKYRHNGENIKTVGDVAAILRVDEKTAALYVLEEEDVDIVLRMEAKGLMAPPASDVSGVAIMLYPSKDDANQIAMEGGTKPKELHVTLGFFGDQKDCTPETQKALLEITHDLGKATGPFDAQLNGISRFTSEKIDPIVVNVDSPSIEAMRTNLTTSLKMRNMDYASDHGFTPHMSIGYVKPDDKHPVDRWKTRSCRFDRVVLAVGPKQFVVPLSGTEEGAKDVFGGSPMGAVSPAIYNVTAPSSALNPTHGGLRSRLARTPGAITKRKKRKRPKKKD